MRTTATNRKIRVLISSVRDGKIIPRPEFQRRLVWSPSHKRAFLETVLMGYPFPEIYIAAGEVNPDTAEGNEMLVDGQQRVTTLYQYFIGSVELGLSRTFKAYADLPVEQKHQFLEYDVVVRDLGSLGIDDIRAVFERINSTSYALNAMEIKNARYDGAFKRFGERVAAHPFFETHRIFSAAEIRRMFDVRFGLVLIISVASTYFRRDDDLDEWLERYNESFPLEEQLYSSLSATFDLIDACEFKPESRAFRKPDLLNLIVELHHIIADSATAPAPAALGPAVATFYYMVDQATVASEPDAVALEYHQAAVQGVNDRGNRVERGRILREVLVRALEETGRMAPGAGVGT